MQYFQMQAKKNHFVIQITGNINTAADVSSYKYLVPLKTGGSIQLDFTPSLDSHAPVYLAILLSSIKFSE